MKNLLSIAKELLAQQAIECYQAFLEDIQLDKEKYISHFANLGEILYEIESIETFSKFSTKSFIAEISLFCKEIIKLLLIGLIITYQQLLPHWILRVLMGILFTIRIIPLKFGFIG